MGKVYLAFDPLIKRKVAIKVLSGDFKTNSTLLKRFYIEAQAAGNLRHPNIVTIFDMGEENDLPYIVMEYLEGESLFNLIKNKKIESLNFTLSVIYQCAKALDYAHSRGIVHRDIKPGNIVILKDKTVKIVDFGIARMENFSLTKDGVALGTPYYMSPEQINGEKVDGRSDIFSLGVVFYEMLTYKRPFYGDNLITIFKKNLSGEIPPIENFYPKCPEKVKEIIFKAMNVDKKKRYQKAEELAKDIEELLLNNSTSFEKTKLIENRPDEHNEFFEKNKELFYLYLERNDFEKAQNIINTISSKIPDNKKVIELKNELSDKKHKYNKNLYIKSKISIARTLIKEGKLKVASNLIEEALQKYPEEKLLLDFLKKIDKKIEYLSKEETLKKSLKEIYEMLQNNNFAVAEKTLKNLMDKYPEDEHLKKLYLNLIKENDK